jgi:hypothetical protein
LKIRVVLFFSFDTLELLADSACYFDSDCVVKGFFFGNYYLQWTIIKEKMAELAPERPLETVVPPSVPATLGKSPKSGREINVELLVKQIKDFAESKDCPQALREPLQKYVAPGVQKGFELLTKLIPHLQMIWAKLNEFWVKLQPYKPELLGPGLMGLIMCFFGGSFLTLIAAYEAFKLTSSQTIVDNCTLLWEDFQKVRDANEKDNLKDENNDGIPDVQQTASGKELLQRKMFLFLKTVDPHRIGIAVAALNTGFLAIIATLKLEFAKTITLGNSIYDTIEPPLDKYLYPHVERAFVSIVPKEYVKWCKPTFQAIIRSFVLSWAWFLQRIISAFHSSIKGGLMFSRNILEYLSKMGIYHLDHENTYIDEIVGVAVAMLGLIFQLRYGFRLPFPLNLLLFPFSIMEWMLMWMVGR